MQVYPDAANRSLGLVTPFPCACLTLRKPAKLLSQKRAGFRNYPSPSREGTYTRKPLERECAEIVELLSERFRPQGSSRPGFFCLLC
jgi:hypothetical protein